MPRSQFEKLNIQNKLTPSNIVFRSYTQDKFVPDDKVQVNIMYNGQSSVEELYIVPDGFSAFIGRTWIKRLKICLDELDQSRVDVKLINSIDIETQDLMRDFPEVFEQRIGCIPNYKVSLKLRESAMPIYNKERKIPYELTETVNKEPCIRAEWHHYKNKQ